MPWQHATQGVKSGCCKCALFDLVSGFVGSMFRCFFRFPPGSISCFVSFFPTGWAAGLASKNYKTFTSSQRSSYSAFDDVFHASPPHPYDNPFAPHDAVPITFIPPELPTTKPQHIIGCENIFLPVAVRRESSVQPCRNHPHHHHHDHDHLHATKPCNHPHNTNP